MNIVSAPINPLLVTTASDTIDDTDGLTSLREAIAFANGQAGLDTITFSADFDGGAEDLIRLTMGEITISDSLVIDGGAANVTITGDALGNDVTVAGTDITDLTATLAVDVSGDGVDNDGDGDTDEAGEDLLSDNSRLFSNETGTAMTFTGLTLTGGRTTEQFEGGGAIYTFGDLTFNDVTLSGNSTAGERANGGAAYIPSTSFFGAVTLNASTVEGNGAFGTSSSAGGFLGVGGVNVHDSVIRDNVAVGLGGGFTSFSDTVVERSVVSGNRTLGDGGQGVASHGGGFFVNRGDLTVRDSEISGNSTAGAGAGGGFAVLDGDITMRDSVVRGNSTTGDFANGGGFGQLGTGSYVADIADSTISGNSTEGDGSTGGGFYGSGEQTMVGVTISGNSTAGTGAFGGGVSSDRGGSIDASTISGNAALLGLGGGAFAGFAGLNFSDSIAMGNFSRGIGDDVFSFDPIAFSNANIIGGELLENGVVVAAVTAGSVFAETEDNNGVLAGKLGDNSGPTQTILIKENGAAQDAALSAAPLATDQRGLDRVFGAAADLGAVELQPIPEDPSLVVTIAGDIVDAFDGETSLREAIAFANGQAGLDTITFSADFDGGAEDLIRLTMGELNITDAVTIDGGAANVTITGDKDDNDITVTGTDITDAKASGAADLLEDNSRVFLVDAETTLTGLTITGGYVGPRTENPVFAADGGGILVRSGDLTVNNANIVGNTAASTVTFKARGGGIAIENSFLTVTDSNVSDNVLVGLFGGGVIDGLGGGRGGGIWSNFATEGAVQISGSEISGNHVDSSYSNGGGGGVWAFYVDVDNTLISDNTLFVGQGSGTRWGGGGLRAEIEANISNSRIVDNTETNFNGSANSFAGGGGFRADFGSLVNSEVSGNSSVGPGGGVRVADDAREGPRVFRIENSTIANNTSLGEGGGVESDTLEVINSTITGNVAGRGAGGVDGGALTFIDTLVLGNSGPDGETVDGSGPVTLTGGNVIGDERSVDGVVVETVSAADVFAGTFDNNGVLAGVLGDNGGPSQTVQILLGGAAQDTGLETPATTTDQRGEARPFGDAGDLGAIELQEAPNSPPVLDGVNALFVTETTDDSPIERSQVVSFEDADLTDDHTVSITFNRVSDGVAPNLTDAELTALLTAGPVMQEAGSTTRSFDYMFSAASTVFDYLAEGEKVTLNYTLSIDDGNGGVLVQTPNVVVTGTDDVSVVLANSHIEFDSARLRLEAGGTPKFVQVALHEGDLNGTDDLEYSTNGTRKDASDDFLGDTLIASELYQRRGGGRFEDESVQSGDLRDGVQDIGGTRTIEGELLNPLLGDILSIDAFKIRRDADELPDSFLFAGNDADGFDPDSGQTVLKGGQGLRAQSNGFGLEFGIDRNGAGRPEFAGDGGPNKEIAGPEVLLITLDDDFVGTGVSFGVDRAKCGIADVLLDFYSVDRDTGLYTQIDETVIVTEIDDGLPTGPGDPLAALDFTFDAVAFSAADGDRFRLEMLEIGTFTDLG